MYTEEKKNHKSYGSIFVYCFFCFLLVVEVARFAKPYYNNLQNIMETEELVVEEGFMDVVNSGIASSRKSRSASVPARNHQKLSQEIRREDRTRAPSTYSVKFQNFATMRKLIEGNGDKYESRPFSAGGYNWTLIIYPNENKPVGSGVFISMYVRIDNSSLIANPHDVYAYITFLTYKSTTDTYRFVQETDAQRFHLFKQEWGQQRFFEVGYYNDPVWGFNFNGGQSMFGVDILVAHPFQNWEVFSYEENIRDPLFTWKRTNYSTLNLYYYTSGWFTSGGSSWELKLYPNGAGNGTGNSVSLFLVSAANEKSYVKATLRVVDQKGSNHVEKQVEGWPNGTENEWGFDKFIPIADIKDSAKGFLVDDTVIFEVRILSFSKTDSL